MLFNISEYLAVRFMYNRNIAKNLNFPRADAPNGRRRLLLSLGVAALFGLAPVASSSMATAQAQNNPIVQVICEVDGGTAKTVRITYPTTAVRNTHIFKPLPGGQNIVFPAPAVANQVYRLPLPAGRYRLSYVHPNPFGGYVSPANYPPVIVIAPFKVVGRICERSQSVGTPAS